MTNGTTTGTASVNDLVQYAQGKVNLQDDPFWSSQPLEIRQQAFNIIQGQNVAQGLTPTTGQAQSSVPGFPSMQAISDSLSTIDPNFTRLQETISGLGFTPRTEEEQLLAIRSTYTPAELEQLNLDQPFQTIQSNFQQAQANLIATPPPSQTSLNVLQDALNAAQGVRGQEIGLSEGFAQAGIPTTGVSGYAVLADSLAERGREINRKYNSFASTVGSIASGMQDSYNRTLQNYEIARDDYNRELDRFNEVQDN